MGPYPVFAIAIPCLTTVFSVRIDADGKRIKYVSASFRKAGYGSKIKRKTR